MKYSTSETLAVIQNKNNYFLLFETNSKQKQLFSFSEHPISFVIHGSAGKENNGIHTSAFCLGETRH